MKRIGKVFLLLAVFCMVFTSISLAQASINTQGLTDEQKAKIALDIAQMKKETGGVPTVEKVSQWVDIGKNVGVALASTAKEIGVATDQFLNSRTGKITLVLIVYKVLGRDIIHFIVGFGMLLSLIPLWVYFFRRLCLIKEVRVEYPNEKFRKIKHYEYRAQGECDGTRWTMLLVLALIILVGLLVAF